MNRKLCLASCFLPFDEENSRWWLQFQTEMDALGMDLVLISAAAAADSRLKTIVVPLWLQGFRQAYGLAPAAMTMEEPLAQALANRDRAWSKQENLDMGEFTAGLSVCQQVFRRFLNELQPAVVLVWSSSLPQSVVLQQLALQQGRPCWVLERGLLPGTLMLEMCGLGGHSELNWSYTVRQALRKSNKNGLFFAAQKAYKRDRTSKYVQAGTIGPAAFQQQFNPDGRKIISLLLQHDASSALVPDTYLGARLHAPEIPTSSAAIRTLSEALAGTPGCRLLVKPHPMDKDDYSRWENERVTICREANLHTLIEVSDVVACMTSTTQFEALLFEKPVLLLARSTLIGKQVAYEGRTPGELPSALAGALARIGFKERMENGRHFIHFLLENFSVSINSEAMPAGTTLADLAKFLAHNSVPIEVSASLGERLLAIGKQLSHWESLPKNTPPAVITNASGNPKQLMNLNYKSHIGQDAWVVECLNFKREGFFLDFGAFDGITISNTYALEKDLGWRGICVEPNPRYYAQACECRSSITVNVALWPKSCETLRFVDAHGLSAIESFKDSDINAGRRAKAIKAVIEVDTLNPNELLARFNAPTLIDFLSLDVEGAEYDVLSALDLEKYSVALMAVEHNHDAPRQKQIRDYLARFGYEVVQNRNDDFFFHRGHLARLTGKTVDPIAVFHRIYNSYPISDGSKTPKPAHPSATKTRSQTSVATPAMFHTSAATPDSLRRLALELCQKKSWHEAGQVFKTLTRSQPDDFEGWRGHIMCCRKQGHAVLANLMLADALRRNPEWAGQLSEIDSTELAPA